MTYPPPQDQGAERILVRIIQRLFSPVRYLIDRGANLMGYRIARISFSDDHLYADYSNDSVSKRRFINVGAGDFIHANWTNVDYATDWYSEAQKVGFVNFDLTECRPLPFDGGTMEAVYSSHTIEHIPDDAVANFVSESFRTLKIGGVLRVTCPDARLLIRSVRLNRISYWKWREDWFSRPYSTNPDVNKITIADYLIREIATERCRFYKDSKNIIDPKELIERIATHSDEEILDWMIEGLAFNNESPGNHINWWTFEKLENLAREVGFQTVYRSGHGQSLCRPMTNLDLFDSTNPHNSLYLEAIR